MLEDVTNCYAEQVRALMETVQQMESALQRRAKLRTAGTSSGAGSSNSTTAPLTDSEKISMQIRLDIEAFGAQIESLFTGTDNVPTGLTSIDVEGMISGFVTLKKLISSSS